MTWLPSQKMRRRKTYARETISAKKKSFTMPHTFVILFVIIAIASGSDLDVPSGGMPMWRDPVSGSTVVERHLGSSM